MKWLIVAGSHSLNSHLPDAQRNTLNFVYCDATGVFLQELYHLFVYPEAIRVRGSEQLD